jgi:hypothetical protein
MKLLDPLKSQILAYLGGAITLAALREWFAPLSMDAESSGDPDAIRAAYQMIGDFSDLDEGFLSDLQLKQNLVNLLFDPPFASPYLEIQFGQAPGFTTGTLTGLEAFALPAFAGTTRALEFA